MSHTIRHAALTTLALCLASPSLVSADLVRLTNGQTMEGIVVQQTPGEIHLQIDWQGYTVLDRGIIHGVVLEDRELNQERLERWQRDHAALRQREQDREAFEAEQQAKGLVKQGTQWVSLEALALLKEEEAKRERQELTRQLAELTERIRLLEAENRALREEASRPMIVREFVPVHSGLVVQHQQTHRRAGSLFRDDQGRVVRVRRHGDHRSFTTADGTRVDLQFQNGRLGYTDPAGVRHELTRVKP
jgi:hypothetical protein